MVQLDLDLHPEAKLVKHRCNDGAVDEATRHANEDLDGDADENEGYTEAAHIPQGGGR